MFLSRWPDLFKEGRVFRIETPLFVATKKGKETLYFYSFAVAKLHKIYETAK